MRPELEPSSPHSKSVHPHRRQTSLVPDFSTERAIPAPPRMMCPTVRSGARSTSEERCQKPSQCLLYQDCYRCCYYWQLRSLALKKILGRTALGTTPIAVQPLRELGFFSGSFPSPSRTVGLEQGEAGERPAEAKSWKGVGRAFLLPGYRGPCPFLRAWPL